MAERILWTRDQLLIALRLYMRTPFGGIDARRPEIIALAQRIGRTPDALAMKALNFASIDPELDRQGLSRVSKSDRELWNEFAGDTESVAAAAEEAFARFDPGAAARDEMEIRIPTGETDVLRTVRARRVQSFFRAAVLTSYEGRCAISGLALPELLVGSHIIPWADSVERRADPRNGVCLNALFDRAFDRGYITIDDNLCIVVSRRLREAPDSAELACSLREAEGRKLRIPRRFPPAADALEHHRRVVFRD